MSIYDQNVQNTTGTPWYAPTNSGIKYPSPTNQQMLNQFVWVNGQGTVDMWPVAAGSEMTFIDNENMMLYVKRVDEFGHPFRTRKFKLTEIKDDSAPTKPEPAVNMDELKTLIASEIDKAVSAKLKEMFTVKTEGNVINA